MNTFTTALIVAIVALIWPGEARAQVPVADRPAFSVERWTPAPGHAGFGTVEEADVLPHLEWSAALWTSLMTRPIVFRDLSTGEEETVPVRWRLGFEASGAIGLGSRYQLGLAIPWGAQAGDRLQGTGLDAAPLQDVVLGDLRLHGRARIHGAPGDRGVAAGLAAALTVPTGDDGDFAGEAGAVVEWKLAAGWRSARAAVGANLGVRIRSREVVLLSPARPHGSELVTGAAGTVAVPEVQALGLPRLWLVGEAVWAIGDSIGGGTRGPSPGELRAGLRIDAGAGWSVTALAGGGVTPADVGSPAWRAVVGITYDRAPLDDVDRDGVIDGRDRCRHDVEDHDGVDDADGCPDPDDDGDGLPDVADACPAVAEDLDGHRDGDGCPDTETWVVPPPPPPSQISPPPLPEWLGLIPEGAPSSTSR